MGSDWLAAALWVGEREIEIGEWWGVDPGVCEREMGRGRGRER